MAFLGNDVGIMLTINYKGQRATVTCPTGHLVYDGTDFVDPTKAKTVMLSLTLDPTGPNANDLATKRTLAQGGADDTFAGQPMAQTLLLCEVIQLDDSSDDTNELLTAEVPPNDRWLMTAPADGTDVRVDPIEVAP